MPNVVNVLIKLKENYSKKGPIIHSCNCGDRGLPANIKITDDTAKVLLQTMFETMYCRQLRKVIV